MNIPLCYWLTVSRSNTCYYKDLDASNGSNTCYFNGLCETDLKLSETLGEGLTRWARYGM
jgi:hypothetical protein